jgi:hypothetical protein
MTMTDTDEKYEALQKIGRCAMASIAEMVAALECDYERLEELREDRDAYEIENNEHATKEQTAEAWAEANPDDAAELAELEAARGECEDRDQAEQRIQEDPLSLEYRSGWISAGEWNAENMQPEEFNLLLSTGGPAVRIIGEIQNGEAHRPRLQAQDWFTSWTDYSDQDTETLEKYCNCIGVGVGYE